MSQYSSRCQFNVGRIRWGTLNEEVSNQNESLKLFAELPVNKLYSFTLLLELCLFANISKKLKHRKRDWKQT